MFSKELKKLIIADERMRNVPMEYQCLIMGAVQDTFVSLFSGIGKYLSKDEIISIIFDKGE